MCNSHQCSGINCLACHSQQAQAYVGMQAQAYYLTQADLDRALQKQAAKHQIEVDALNQINRAQSELITALRMQIEATIRLHELERK
jgi:hypothetical protein